MDRSSFFEEIPGADLEELKGKLIVISLLAITAAVNTFHRSRLIPPPSREAAGVRYS